MGMRKWEVVKMRGRILWGLLRVWSGDGREGGDGKASVVLIGGKRRAKRSGRKSIVRYVLVVTIWLCCLLNIVREMLRTLGAEMM